MENLLAIAREAQNNAYAPYSGFRVGVALRCKNGKVYTGCNIENASFSPTMCAERVAFAKALSDGEREFDSICIVSGDKPCPPCGVCRQVMQEFCDKDFKILLTTGSFTLAELLPHGFSKEEIY